MSNRLSREPGRSGRGGALSPSPQTEPGSGGPGASARPHGWGESGGEAASPAPPVGAAPGRLDPWWVGLPALVLLVGFSLLNGWIWSASLPFGRGPDEFDHWAMVDFIRSHGRLPVFERDPELPIRFGPDGQPVEPYSLYPPLPYLGAALLTLVPVEPWRAARLLSLACAAGTVIAAWLLARQLAPGSPFVRLAVPAFVALLPQFSFVAAYLNADAPAALLGALSLAVALVGLRDGWTLRLSLLAGLLLGLGVVTRYTLFAVWPTLGLALLLGSAPPGAAGQARRAGRLGLAGLAFAAVAGPWLWRNLALYGEPIPERVLQEALAAAAPGYALSLRARGWSLVDAATYPIWWQESFRSFWGAFDWQRVFYPSPVYYALFLVCALGALGFVLVLARHRPTPTSRAQEVAPGTDPSRAPYPAPTEAPSRRELLLVIVLPVACALFLSLWSTWARDPSPQGRYLFPALPAIAAALALGWQRLTTCTLRAPVLQRRSAGGERDRWSRAAAGAILWNCSLGALNVASLALVVLPLYFGGGEVAEAVVTVDVVQPAPGGVELQGWALARVRPVWSPVALLRPARFYEPAAPLAFLVRGRPAEPDVLERLARSDVDARYGGVALGPVGYRATLAAGGAPVGGEVEVCAQAPPGPNRCAGLPTGR